MTTGPTRLEIVLLFAEGLLSKSTESSQTSNIDHLEEMQLSLQKKKIVLLQRCYLPDNVSMMENEFEK